MMMSREFKNNENHSNDEKITQESISDFEKISREFEDRKYKIAARESLKDLICNRAENIKVSPICLTSDMTTEEIKSTLKKMRKDSKDFHKKEGNL